MDLLSRSSLSGSSGAELVVVAPPAPLERHPVSAYLLGLSLGSRRTMLGALKAIAKFLTGKADELAAPWHRLGFEHTTAIRAWLASTRAPATANRMLAALRGTLKAAFKLGLMSSDDMTRATMIDPVRGVRVPPGRALSQGELRVLFGACDPKTAGGARDGALIALLYAGGLRRAEATGLDVEAFDETSGALIVRGKGNKERRVYLSSGARDAVDAWLQHRGREAGPLLMPVRCNGVIVRRRMTDQAVAERLRRLARRGQLAHFSAHSLRRTFVSDLLDAGVDIVTVAALAGHSSPAVSAKYDRRGERAKERAAGVLHVPFARSA